MMYEETVISTSQVDSTFLHGTRMPGASHTPVDSFFEDSLYENTWKPSSGTIQPESKVAYSETADLPTGSMTLALPYVSPTYRLMTRLRDLHETPEDVRWPGAVWPTKRALKDAEIFIASLPLLQVPEPDIRFADDGEVNFLWLGGNVHLDLGFYGTGTYSYFGCNAEGKEIQGENVSASEGLIPAIENILTNR